MNDDQTYTVGKGDVDPRPLEVGLYDSEDNPISVADVNRVRFKLRPVESEETVLDVRAETGEEDNVLRYEWTRGDLDIPPRTYLAWFDIRFADRTTLTAPTIGRLFVDVVEVT